MNVTAAEMGANSNCSLYLNENSQIISNLELGKYGL